MIRALVFLIAIWAAPAFAQDGAALFARDCATCHALAPGPANLPGPGLALLAGRIVAGDPDYDYSPALRGARAEGRRWDRASLDRFLDDPDAMFPGLWMGGLGVRAPQERAAIVEFLLR